MLDVCPCADTFLLPLSIFFLVANHQRHKVIATPNTDVVNGLPLVMASAPTIVVPVPDVERKSKRTVVAVATGARTRPPPRPTKARSSMKRSLSLTKKSLPRNR